MSRWVRYVLRPRVWMETSRSKTVPHIGSYNYQRKMILDNITTTLIIGSELDFDNSSLSEVIKFLQRMAKDPHTSALNIAFTEHITNALIKAREEKIKLENYIPRKLEDGRDPMVKIKLNNFSCFTLCDVGASASVLLKRMDDMLELKPFDPCSFGVHLVHYPSKID